MSKAKPKDFETAMAELDRLVTALEAGELSLEESLSAFEKGMALSGDCQKLLNDAEQKVQVLIKQNGATTSAPLPDATS